MTTIENLPVAEIDLVNGVRVSVIVPARNEARNLEVVLPSLPPVHEVILVDGHSTDDTIETAQRVMPGIRVVQQTRRGKGNALACGFEAATGDIIVMFDADGSADASEIERFVVALLDGADFAKGSRFCPDGGTEDITPIRRLGNWFLSSTTNVLFKSQYTDLCYGYNAFWSHTLNVLDLPDTRVADGADAHALMWGDGFEVETMINCRVIAGGLQIAEVASVEQCRIFGESNLHAVRDGLRVLRTILSEKRRSRVTRTLAASAAQKTLEPSSSLGQVIDLRSAAPLVSSRGSELDLLATMQSVAPPGLRHIGPSARARLSTLTTELANTRHGAADEYLRYTNIRGRQLGVPERLLRQPVAGRTLMVTGGTGCIGSELVRQLTALGAARVVSVSRGLIAPPADGDGAEYRFLDVRDAGELDAAVESVQPDLIFHLAAVRDPGRAEHEVYEAVSTNLLGTRNVMSSADRYETPGLIYASTGKAVRYYTGDVYAATKKVGEWMSAAGAVASPRATAAVRFTHVVDNSIIHTKLKRELAAGMLELHAPHMAMYAQSAVEAAQLMVAAAGDARPGQFNVYTMQNLGYFFEVLDIALGMRQLSGSDAGLYFTGYRAGYEAAAYPGLYQPVQAAETGPLVNAIEASSAESLAFGEINRVPILARTSSQVPLALEQLLQACASTTSASTLRSMLDTVSLYMLEDRFATACEKSLARLCSLSETQPSGCGEHETIDRVLGRTLQSMTESVA